MDVYHGQGKKSVEQFAINWKKKTLPARASRLPGGRRREGKGFYFKILRHRLKGRRGGLLTPLKREGPRWKGKERERKGEKTVKLICKISRIQCLEVWGMKTNLFLRMN